jgi:aspartate racemase
MKTIGLIGGMSWESSAVYYRLVNEAVRRQVGGLSSAPCLLHSVDFAVVEAMQREARWDDAAGLLAGVAARLEGAGAELVVLCTNTMHRVADAIEARLGVPFLHIADATGAAVARAGLGRVGLLGTRFTMEQDFYRGRLAARHGLDVLVPDDAERELVHRVIYDELCQGRIEPASRVRLQAVVAGLAARGAEGVVLGCTELPLLLTGGAPVPLFDTTRLHAEAAVAHALA